MKKLYALIISSLAYASIAIAQPTLTPTNFIPGIGDNQMYYVADTNSVIDPTVGANVVFNYTGLRGYGMTQNQYIVNASTTTNGGSFPSATYADTSDATAANIRYAQSFAPDSLDNIGFVAQVPGYGTVVAQYDNDPEILMSFPFNYGDSYMDNYSGNFSLLSQNTNGAGNATVSADAWGQLQLPLGVTIDSVLRVRTVEYLLTDTIFITLPPITILPVEITGEYINYYKPSLSKFPLLSYVSGVIKQNGSVVDSNRTFISQYALPGVGIDEVSNSVSEMNLFPNPTNKETVTLTLDLKKSAMIRVDLMNNIGQHIQSIYNHNTPSGTNKIDITTSDLSPGIYLVNVSIDNAIVTKKLIVQ